MINHLTKVTNLLTQIGDMIDSDDEFQIEVEQILTTQRQVTREVNRALTLQDIVNVIEVELKHLVGFDWVSVIFYNKRFRAFYTESLRKDAPNQRVVEDFANAFFPKLDQERLDPTPILSSVQLHQPHINLINQVFNESMKSVVNTPIILKGSLFAHILIGSSCTQTISSVLLKALDTVSEIVVDAIQRTPEYVDLDLWYLTQKILKAEFVPAALLYRGAIKSVNDQWQSMCDISSRELLNTNFLTYITNKKKLTELADMLLNKIEGVILQVPMACNDKEYIGDLEVVWLGDPYNYSLIKIK